MRFVRILNISVIVLFVILWIVLLIKKESYQGDGLLRSINSCKDTTYFSSDMPYGIIYRGDFMGFTTQKTGKNKAVATGLWKINLKTQSVFHYPFPATHRFDSLISIQPASDSTLFFVGLVNDSIVKLIHFDTLVKPGLVFTAPSDIKAVQYINGHPEIVFGRQKKLVGSIATVGDSSVKYRKYELPGFFNRICEIVAAYPENNKWRFLLQTNFHRKNDKWVLIESNNKTNFLVFDERAVYPDYPGLLKMSSNKIAEQFDYTISGLVPHEKPHDTLLLFNNNKFKTKAQNKPKSNSNYWFSLIGTQLRIIVSEWDNPDAATGFLLRHLYRGVSDATLPFATESGKYIFHQPGKSDQRQIFLGENEQPIGYFRLQADSNLFITNRLNMAFLNDDGRLLDRKNFFTLVNTTILRKQPGSITLLDGNFPTLRAIVWFILLYGLIPLWVISLVITWLVAAIRPKPKFAVRERIWPFSLRLLPGSGLYLLLYLFNIYPFLQSFSIHFF